MEWISTEKQLPKVNQRVLCSNINDKWVVAGYLATNKRWYNQFEDKTTDVDITVTHWMPLPKPPKQ